MLDETHSVDLSRHDLDLIEAALATQEKILAMQSRAGGEEARTRLNDLKGVVRRLRRHGAVPATGASDGWSRIARSLFC